MKGCTCAHDGDAHRCPIHTQADFDAAERTRERDVNEDVETLADESIGALVFSSGHLTADGTGGRALRLHVLTCPTCSATIKTAARLLANARADAAEKALAPVLALAEVVRRSQEPDPDTGDRDVSFFALMESLSPDTESEGGNG